MAPPPSTRPACIPNFWVNPDPELSFEDPTLAPLLAYWRQKRGDRPLPARRDIDPIELREHLGTLCLIEVEAEPLRMRYRLVGSSITQIMGRDATGRCYDELYPADAMASFNAVFRWLLAERRPIRCFGQAHRPGECLYRYEALNLPLAEDGKQVSMVLGKLVLRLAAL